MSETRPFSKEAWAGGCATAMLFGLLGMAVLLMNVNPHSRGSAALLGMIPGAVLGAVGLWNRRTPFGIGVLTGAMLTLIIGGLCGAGNLGGF